ncbi:hypothetical protein F4821DRAFT_22492 [Hypoxylon rubiginosum]|uniref:Uncharacterized protein n=1 Tax=Hypoxylon rubiginosum TaxID=110542 RepID=A0ACC0DD50_9PEZI|nr:hypothetical protein F4821DRAFT_22492 [Hypoxylon rubiginosum]
MTNFFSLPRELRDQIYELCLLREEPLNPSVAFCPTWKTTTGLFRTSKAVHSESSWVFYSRNCFNLVATPAVGFAAFIGAIGRNANYIRNLRVYFPMFSCLDPGKVALEDGSSSILATIQNSCTNLSTLTTSAGSSNAMELSLDALDHPKVAAEALKLVDTQFKAISSSPEIVVELYEDCASDYIRRTMESHGWRISIVENMEEEGSDGSWGGFDDYYDDYGPYHDSDDERYKD